MGRGRLAAFAAPRHHERWQRVLTLQLSRMKRKARSNGDEALRGVWLRRMQAVFEDGPTWPLLELKRRAEVLRLRRTVADWPRESFNRWLMERLNTQGVDPLLGSGAQTELDREADRAAEGLARQRERCEREVVATLEARRGCYVLSLAGEEPEFTVSPSALARLAPLRPVDASRYVASM